MAPNYGIITRYGRKGQRQIQRFLISNVAPMTPALNRGPWKKLEQGIARRYANSFEDVWVVTGPLFDNREEDLDSGIEIPNAFFKIVIDEKEGRLRALGFILKEDAQPGAPSRRFLTSINRIEIESGFDFFHGLNDRLEDRLEIVKPRRLWRAEAPVSHQVSADSTSDREDVALGAIDVDSASREQLESLSGVGPVISGRIIEGRPYSSFRDLLQVKGIGPARFENIKPRVTVGR